MVVSKFFRIFTLIFGEMIQFDAHIFQSGSLKSPTRKLRQYYIWFLGHQERCWFIRIYRIWLRTHYPQLNTLLFSHLPAGWVGPKKTSYKCNEVITPINRLTYNPWVKPHFNEPHWNHHPVFSSPHFLNTNKPNKPNKPSGIGRSPRDVEETEATWSSWRYFWHTWKQGTTIAPCEQWKRWLYHPVMYGL